MRYLFIAAYFPRAHHEVLELSVADGAPHTICDLEGMGIHWVIFFAIFFLPSTQLVESAPDLHSQASPAEAVEALVVWCVHLFIG